MYFATNWVTFYYYEYFSMDIALSIPFNSRNMVHTATWVYFFYSAVPHRAVPPPPPREVLLFIRRRKCRCDFFFSEFTAR